MKRKTYTDRNGAEVDIIDESKIIRGIDRGNNMIELENNVWLRDRGDGRYHVDGDELIPYSAVIDGDWQNIDGELDFVSGDVIGYIAI